MISFTEDLKLFWSDLRLKEKKRQLSNWAVEVGGVFQNSGHAQPLNRKVRG